MARTQQLDFVHPFRNPRRTTRPSPDRFVTHARPKTSLDSVSGSTIPNAQVSSKTKVKRPKPTYAKRIFLPRQSRSKVLKRTGLKGRVITAAESMAALRSTKSVAITVSAIAGLVLLGFGVISYFKTDTLVEQYASVIKNSGLDETPISEAQKQAYRVAADAPRLLAIPGLNAEAIVKTVGIKENGQPMDTNNIHEVGWFEQSSKPGSGGTALLIGHEVGTTQNGVLANSGKLQPGDQLLLELGDGSILNYRVAHVQTYDYNKVDMTAALNPFETGKSGLNLLTSTGPYDVARNTYRQRILVFSILE